MQKVSPVPFRHGSRPRWLVAVRAAMVLATASLLAVADVASPDGIQGTSHRSAAAVADGIQDSG